MLTGIIFLNGLSIMILEMAGARMLAPWLGTSTIVWTSIIGIILGCLSLGNWLGGYIADSVFSVSLGVDSSNSADYKKNYNNAGLSQKSFIKGRSELSLILLVASGSITAVVLLHSSILPFFLSYIDSLYLTAIGISITFFSLPSIMCGMVSPFVIRMAIQGEHQSGRIIGRMNAIATLGSIVGTFLGGFVLVSWFGTSQIIFGVAGTFLFASVIVYPKRIYSPILLTTSLCGGLFLQNYANSLRQDTFIKETPYNTIKVLKGTLNDRSVTLLQTDPGSYQSAAYDDDPSELLFSYTKLYQIGTLARPQAKKILMLGGGGYSIPKWLLANKSGLTSKNFMLDVVEIDPEITQIAQKYFFFSLDDQRIHTYHEDARVFINRLTRKKERQAYDLIFADVFNSHYSVPFYLGTREAASKIKHLLAEDGLFIMNIISAIDGPKGRLFRSIYAAFSKEFSSVQVFPVQHTTSLTQVQNIILVGSLNKKPFDDLNSPRLNSLLKGRLISFIQEDVPPLTDNYAPVERYLLGF